MPAAMVDPQAVILGEIADKRMTRDDLALTYAFCINQQDEVDFPTVNKAIVAHRSMAALRYVKEKAWRYVEDSRASRKERHDG